MSAGTPNLGSGVPGSSVALGQAGAWSVSEEGDELFRADLRLPQDVAKRSTVERVLAMT